MLSPRAPETAVEEAAAAVAAGVAVLQAQRAVHPRAAKITPQEGGAEGVEEGAEAGEVVVHLPLESKETTAELPVLLCPLLLSAEEGEVGVVPP